MSGKTAEHLLHAARARRGGAASAVRRARTLRSSELGGSVQR